MTTGCRWRSKFRYRVRGWAHSGREDWKAAITDFTAAIAADAKDASIRVQRAFAFRQVGNAKEAREDLDRAIADNPKLADAYAERGHLAQHELEDPRLAKSDYRKVVELRPTNATDLQALAWLLATCSDEKIRDGVAAVAIAQKACELTDWKKARHLDALAAAYAEAGRFDAAADYAAKAAELAEPGDKASISERLELYKVGKPYRE